MKGIKFVQSGDFHLDSPLTSHHEPFRKERREELLEMVSRLVDIAIKEQAELLLLAGDLFDGSRVEEKTLQHLENQWQRFPGRIFIAPGNHDPYTMDSVYEKRTFPPNVTIFKDYEEVYVEDLDLVIGGQGFTKAMEPTGFLTNIQCMTAATFRMLLLHGEISNQDHPYNPIRLAEISSSGYQYVALGHRHSFSGLQKEGDVYYAYAGMPEGRGFDELGEKGILIGTLYEEVVTLKFHPLAKRTYEEVQVDVTGILTRGDLLKTIERKLVSVTTIYKVLLKGMISPYFRLPLEELQETLRLRRGDIRLEDHTILAKDTKTYAPHSLRHLFLQAVEQKRQEGLLDEEMLQSVETLGLTLLSPKEYP